MTRVISLLAQDFGVQTVGEKGGGVRGPGVFEKLLRDDLNPGPYVAQVRFNPGSGQGREGLIAYGLIFLNCER